MRSEFPTREQLGAMPIARLRNLDIKEKDEEELVQEILSLRLSLSPEAVREIQIRVPDIKTAEEEAFWQKKVDEARLQASEAIAIQGKIEDTENIAVSPQTEVPAEVKSRGRKKKS